MNVHTVGTGVSVTGIAVEPDPSSAVGTGVSVGVTPPACCTAVGVGAKDVGATT